MEDDDDDDGPDRGRPPPQQQSDPDAELLEPRDDYGVKTVVPMPDLNGPCSRGLFINEDKDDDPESKARDLDVKNAVEGAETKAPDDEDKDDDAASKVRDLDIKNAVEGTETKAPDDEDKDDDAASKARDLDVKNDVERAETKAPDDDDPASKVRDLDVKNDVEGAETKAPDDDDRRSPPSADDEKIKIASSCRSDGGGGGGDSGSDDNNYYSSRGSLSSDAESDDGGIVTFLDKSNDEAEARLAARRQARAEAREIRMREIERQQKEAEENADKAFDLHSADGSNRVSRVGGNSASPRTPSSVLNNSYQSSRRNSVDSLDESTPNFRDIRMELKDLEEKFRKSMVQNAQLDNEKAAVTYMVELYKDKYTDIEEELLHIKREHKESSRENEKLKRLLATQKIESMSLKQELEERDKLIEEKGLVIISTEQVTSDDFDQNNKKIKRALVSVENAQLLQHAGEGCLDVRLKKLTEERNSYLEEIKQLKLELQEAKCYSDSHCNGSDSDDLEDVQKETNKVLGDYKFKWQKAEQDISTLQANVARLESQVIRYKTASEAAEKAEDELKLEKRKLQRELRESQAKVEELETSNMHLLKRFDKLKNAKSSLLKDL